MSLLVTGTIGIDTVHTPTGKRERVLGGSCSYFAAAASYQTSVRVVGAVGGDWPEEHRNILGSFRNISTEGLEERKDSKTFAWGGKYFENMNRRETLFTELGVLEEAPPVIPESYRDSRFIFLGNTHPAVQMDFLAHLPQRQLVVADTMDLWINIAHDELIALLRNVDGLIINDSEAEQLTGIPNAVSAGRAILDRGPTWVVVKKGEHGAVLVHEKGVATQPAYPADLSQVVDPTGAGDSFAGGMLGFLASRGQMDFHAIQTAMAWGTVTASFTIEQFGLDGLVQLTNEELNNRMRVFQAAARIGEPLSQVELLQT